MKTHPAQCPCLNSHVVVFLKLSKKHTRTQSKRAQFFSLHLLFDTRAFTFLRLGSGRPVTLVGFCMAAVPGFSDASFTRLLCDCLYCQASRVKDLAVNVAQFQLFIPARWQSRLYWSVHPWPCLFVLLSATAKPQVWWGHILAMVTFRVDV